MKVLLVACFAILTVASGFPAVSQWTLQELSDAIQDPHTDPLVLPYLINALDDMMLALWHGVPQGVATVVLPDNVVNAINGGDLAIVDVKPVLPVAPVLPEAPVQAKSSPLVQIILNINAKQASSPVAPEIVETPVILPEMVETPVILPEIVETPIVHPAVTLPEVVTLPEAVVVAPPLNPIDQVAIEALPVNPVDILHPIGVVGGSAGGIPV